MALKSREQIEQICIEGWYGGGWGLTPREFLDLSFKTVDGQQSNTGDVVAEIRGMSLTRYMASSFWQDFGQYNQGFRAGYQKLEEENEKLRARLEQAEAVALRSGCLLDELAKAKESVQQWVNCRNIETAHAQGFTVDGKDLATLDNSCDCVACRLHRKYMPIVKAQQDTLKAVFEADKRGELHRDPLDTDKLFKDVKRVIKESEKVNVG